jgi:hypothetical protein
VLTSTSTCTGASTSTSNFTISIPVLVLVQLLLLLLPVPLGLLVLLLGASGIEFVFVVCRFCIFCASGVELVLLFFGVGTFGASGVYVFHFWCIMRRILVYTHIYIHICVFVTFGASGTEFIIYVLQLWVHQAPNSIFSHFGASGS